MPGKYVISLNYANDNTDNATVAFVVANAAVASDKEPSFSCRSRGLACRTKAPRTRFTKRASRR